MGALRRVLPRRSRPAVPPCAVMPARRGLASERGQRGAAARASLGPGRSRWQRRLAPPRWATASPLQPREPCAAGFHASDPPAAVSQAVQGHTEQPERRGTFIPSGTQAIPSELAT